MKNYKFIFFATTFVILGMFVLVTYIEIPAPNKIKIKVLDVNNHEVN